MSSRVGERRRGRELALQILYLADIGKPADLEEAMELFWTDKPVAGPVREFAQAIARGTAARREEIDGLLQATAHNWRIGRMPAVDRNILRMALYEFLSEPETPRVVVIDEAIEIAKKFGNEDSSVFINGVLDAVRRQLEESDQKARDSA